jgi:PAS domain S-box-containing protein
MILKRVNMNKIKLSLLLIFIVSIAIFSGGYYLDTINKLKLESYQLKVDETIALFHDEVDKKHGNTSALTYLISKDSLIVNALLQKNSNLLNFNEIVTNIEYFGGYKNLWIQITDKDGYSFYRSWTDKVGDYAAGARLDIADMIENPRPMQTISTGRFDMTFKTMLPIYHNDQFIGMVEVISKFNSIANEFQRKGIEPLFVLHKDYTSRFIKPFTGLFIGNNYIANLNANKSLMQKIEKEGINNFIYMPNNYQMFENYVVALTQIKDIHGGEMGFFLFFIEQKSINTASVDSFKTNFLIAVIVFIIIFILTLLYLINRTFVKQLSIEVENKTAKIRSQQEYLNSILAIYDKNVIFSKTDLRGYITHASEAFCKISGYSQEELIGKPHNIVRHPDTPKEAFKFLWDNLKQEKKVTLEIKNKKKNGDFYWVEGEYEPYYDKDGKLVGYSAVRKDITLSKEIEDIQKEIIFNMGSIGESRSKETGNHVKRVAEYSKLLATYYGLNEEQSQMLYQASPMHDIGKVAIEDSILHKAGKLTDEEFEIMKQHAQKGYDLLANSTRPLLQSAAIVALTHHEKYDGSGYPKGLCGEEIHIYGRITAIADVFDALGSDRCYKKAWDDEKIFQFFKNERGKHFDPILIDIFFDNLEEFLKIRDSIKDI